MTDTWKLIVSFLVAIIVSTIVAIIGNALTEKTLEGLAVWAVSVNAYVLYFGFQRNGELERSIGGFLNQLTPWVIPTGISWWIPRPFGQSLRKTNIALRELDRTKVNGNQLTEVLTRDNNEVEVSYFTIYEIVDLLTWVRLSDDSDTPELGATRAFGALMDRGVRWFCNQLLVESLPRQKLGFSKYLMGEAKLPKAEEFDDGTTTKRTRDKNAGDTDISEVALQTIGVRIHSVKVDDINIPEEIVKARQKEAAERAEASQEQRDIEALGTRAKELQKLLGIKDPVVALTAAQAARGDIRVIRVDGNAGDFTKGAAVNENPRESGK